MSEHRATPGPSAPEPAPQDAAAERRRRALLAGFLPGADPMAAAGDPDPAVRAAALGAGARTGALTPEDIGRALGDDDPLVRRRAGSLAGAALASDPALLDALAGPLVAALGDADHLVAESAAWALGEAGAQAAVAGGGRVVDELCAVAGAHGDPLVRESAVAALGAIGAPQSLDTVLAALDGPPALRRRAAVALAGFDDPKVDPALQRCLADRDWQVREVAETLLDVHGDDARRHGRRPDTGEEDPPTGR